MIAGRRHGNGFIINKLAIALFCVILALISAVDIMSGTLYDNLTLNYADFSYITSIALGFRYAYFGTTYGIIRYDMVESRWAEPLTGIEGLPHSPILRIEASFDDERVCVETEDGFYEYVEIFNRWENLDNWPNYQNQSNHVYPKWQFIAPPGYTYLMQGALEDWLGRAFDLTDMVADRQGNLWIGSRGLGAILGDEYHYTMEFLPYGLIQNDIAALDYDDGRIYIGGLSYDDWRTGVTVFDWNENRFDYLETIPTLINRAPDIFDIKTDGRHIYLGTSEGVKKINIEDSYSANDYSNYYSLLEQYVQCLEVNERKVFAGTPDGLYILDQALDSTASEYKRILANREIVSLLIDDEHLWIGTDRGGFRYSLQTERLTRLKAPEITQNGYIFDIDANDKAIWMATEEELVKIDKESAEISLFPEVNIYGGVTALAVKDTLVAAAVDKGLLLIFNGERDRHILFNEADGLASDQIRDLIFIEDYIWLGTDKGLIRFWYSHPEIY